MWNPLMFHKLKTVNEEKASDISKNVSQFLKRFASSGLCGSFCHVSHVILLVTLTTGGSPLKILLQNCQTQRTHNNRQWRRKRLATAFNRPRDNVVKSQKNEHSPHVLLVFNRRFLAIKQLTA